MNFRQDRELSFLADVACGFWERWDNLEASAVNWERVLELSVRHRVSLCFWQNVPSNWKNDVPDHIKQKFQTLHRQQVYNHLAQLSETQKLLRLLDKTQLRYLMFKGNALGEQLFPGNPELRESVDIDLLIDPVAFQTVNDALLASGYTRQIPGMDVPKSAESMSLLLNNAFRFISPNGRTIVEIHQNPIKNPDVMNPGFDSLFEPSQEIIISNERVRTFSLEHQYIYLCCHAVKHRFFRLKWLLDLVLISKTMSSDQFQRVHSLAKDLNAEKHVTLSSHVISEVANMRLDVPDDASSNISPHDIVYLKAECITAVMENPIMPPPHLSWSDIAKRVRDLKYEFALGTNVRMNFYSVLPYLCNNHDTTVLKLGREWTWLYAILGRPIALLRYFKLL